MNLANQVRILDEAVGISLRANNLDSISYHLLHIWVNNKQVFLDMVRVASEED